MEARLGMVLPDDYKDFLREYGSGRVGQFLWIFNPFSKNENLNLERQVRLQAAVLRELGSYGGGSIQAIPRERGYYAFWHNRQRRCYFLES